MTLAGRKSTCCRIGVIGEIVSWCFWHDGGDSYDLEEVVLPWQGGGNSIGNCSMVVEWNNLRRCISDAQNFELLLIRGKGLKTWAIHIDFTTSATGKQHIRKAVVLSKWMKRTRFHNPLMPVHAPIYAPWT
jgi:hypothetical protein